MFNLVVSQRINDCLTQKILENDYVQLAGSNSFFCVKSDEIAETQARLAQQDLLLTAPLIGERSLELECNPAEKAIIEQHAQLVALMQKSVWQPLGEQCFVSHKIWNGNLNKKGYG